MSSISPTLFALMITFSLANRCAEERLRSGTRARGGWLAQVVFPVHLKAVTMCKFEMFLHNFALISILATRNCSSAPQSVAEV